MADDLKKLAEAAKATSVLDYGAARFQLQTACTPDAILSLYRERDEAEAALRIVQNAAKAIAAAHDTELQHLRQNAAFDHKLRAEHESLKALNSQLTEMHETAEASLSSAQEDVARLKEALQKLETAASSMLVGIGVHNDRHVARDGSRIEGPVVTALYNATRSAGVILKEPATLTQEPPHER